jgi:hypothetical protein
MSGARRGPDNFFYMRESPVTAIATPIILSGLDQTRPHCFAGVQFFSDAGGTTPATPTTGTVTVEIKSINTELFEPAPGGTIIADAPTTISWAANTLAVQVTPAAVDVASHYKLVVTCNET